MDIVDEAASLDSMFLDAAKQNQQRESAKSHLKPNGYCYFCGEELEQGKLFCDKDCRDMYEKEQKMKRIQGRI